MSATVPFILPDVTAVAPKTPAKSLHVRAAENGWVVSLDGSYEMTHKEHVATTPEQLAALVRELASPTK